MDYEEENSSGVLRRTADYQPQASWRTWLIGHPLPTADAPHQTIGKLVGLAVFASDALSSTAYATQEMLVILIAAGSIGMGYSVYIVLAIVALLGIVTLSYEQTLHAYPNGGGSYIVSRDNLGRMPSLVAAAALLTDYILTVAVSISSGVAQVISAFPELFDFRVWMAIVFVLMIMVVNLRGVKESGVLFAIPTYFFIFMMVVSVLTGFIRYITNTLGTVPNPPHDMVETILHPVSFFLILRAFSNGTTALTGIEAISDGITAFKEPRSKNAGITLIWMSSILGVFLLGITFLAHQIGALPSEEETIISQLGRVVFDGRGPLYLATIAATAVILVMAANTAFADFPRLSAFTAADGYLPRQFTFRGSRLVFSTGIMALALIACVLIFLFQASVSKLIPLYAVGVFLSFTLSQMGMAHRWWKCGHMQPGEEVKERGSVLRFEARWKLKMAINAFGGFCTAVVAVIFGVTKFQEGAWIIIVLIPIMVAFFMGIHHHYVSLAKDLSLDNYGAPPRTMRHRVILPVSGVHRGTLADLRYARQLSDDITAVHISIDPIEAEKNQTKWEIWGEGTRLVILDSPYRLFLEPLLEYIDELDSQRLANEEITIVVPRFVPRGWWKNFMHTRTADTLRKVLLFRKNIVIIEVPYQVE